MASPETSEELSRLQSSTVPAPDKIAGYEALLKRILANSSPAQLTADLTALLDAALGESLGIVLSRQLLTTIVSELRSISNHDVIIQVGRHALDLQQSRVVSFEEQDAQVREMLADAYEVSGNHSAAAKVLQGVQLETSQRGVSNEDKIGVWIRIVRNYLEDDDPLAADVYLNKAKTLLHLCHNQGLKLMFQLSHARILDAQRKFLEASREYHDLSFSSVVVEEERMQALTSAIICAVLAPAGPQRSRSLARLYRDGRAHQLAEFGILEKMFLDRLISPKEVESFAAGLAEHQLARTADGSTVLARAVTEHNLVGASKVYEDIGFDDLGVLLGRPAEESEEYAARMIEQGRLNGWIDQLDGLIYFLGNDHDEKATSIHSEDTLRLWDHDVLGLNQGVEKLTSLLKTEFPVSAKSIIISSYRPLRATSTFRKCTV